uniref:Notum, palmitoleoyl-protein carboxylesterase n=1 Tax=Panthera tigris altaica TaxID=74533 RepID=A0A8C9KDT5_PANTA
TLAPAAGGDAAGRGESCGTPPPPQLHSDPVRPLLLPGLPEIPASQRDGEGAQVGPKDLGCGIHPCPAPMYTKEGCELPSPHTPSQQKDPLPLPSDTTGTGILSSQPEENPHWWNANMVFIPYCSSDVWSGASSKSEKNEYAFMGALIIQEVVRELLGKGLSGAKVLLLAGSRWARQGGGLCVQGLWTGVPSPRPGVPGRVSRQGPAELCPPGPVFVVQWLFDEAQLTVDNVHLTGQPVQEGQWLYIQNLGRELRNTLKDVPASWAPACLSHEIIIRSHWTDVQVKGTSLPRALHCWDRSLHDSHKAGKAPLKGCPVHLVDSCPWPHCNPSCPTIRDQFTGQEMNVAQFLMHMGFDVQTVAQQQGLEPSKLLGMLSSGS